MTTMMGSLARKGAIAICAVAALTAMSGIWVAATGWAADGPRLSAGPMTDIGTHV